MNLAYYVLVFDAATDLLCEAIGFGAAHRRNARTGVFVAETHTLYRTELLLGDQVRVWSQVIGADAKRIHLAHEMLRGDAPAAHQELMLLHVSLDTRRVAPFPPEVAAQVSAIATAHALLPRPGWLGRRVAMPAAAPA